MSRRKTNVYRRNRMHVMARMCDTCIFRPGNLMDLEPGRVESMVAECERNDGCIPCHKTLGQTGGEAVCRGMYEFHRSPTLHLAECLGVVKFQE